MPTPPKAMGQMTKHMTKEEIAAREAAESETMPQRDTVRLIQPHLMTSNKKAKDYWKQILERMEDVGILDDLDSEMLGVYCVMLSRYDKALADIRAARRSFGKAKQEADSETMDRALAQLGAYEKSIQKLETTMLAYADKLGLTPAGRVRLAQKRAALAAEAEPDGDLFG